MICLSRAFCAGLCLRVHYQTPMECIAASTEENTTESLPSPLQASESGGRSCREITQESRTSGRGLGSRPAGSRSYWQACDAAAGCRSCGVNAGVGGGASVPGTQRACSSLVPSLQGQVLSGAQGGLRPSLEPPADTYWELAGALAGLGLPPARMRWVPGVSTHTHTPWDPNRTLPSSWDLSRAPVERKRTIARPGHIHLFVCS